MNNTQTILLKRAILLIGFSVLLLLYCWFIYLINGNSIIYDEIRIVADFFTEYQATDSFVGKLKALFRRENETFPAFIRFIYLLSYWLVGNVRFDVIAYVANAIPAVFLVGVFIKRKEFKISAILVLIFSFIILNPYSDHIFLFTYASLFYFISILFPIGIVYAYVKKLDLLLFGLIVILGLSSSTYFIIGLMLFAVAIYQKRWKSLLMLLITVIILKLIPILLFDATDDTDKAGVIVKSLSYIPDLLKLFFLTVGSWVQVFNLQMLNNYAIIFGIITFLGTIGLYVKIYFERPKDDKLQFYGILFVYFWLIFFSTTVFRWNFNYDYQYNAIFSPSKSFFVLVYLTLTIAFVYSYLSRKMAKNTIIALSGVFVISFFVNYFNGINYWKTIYQNTVLAGVNYKTQSSEVDYRNLTFRAGYADMVNKKLLVPASTPFSGIDLEQMIRDSTFVSDSKTGIDLYNEAAKNEVNMYDISIKPIVLYSYDFPFKGSWTNRMDGTYIYLTSPSDKFILPSRYINNSIFNYVIKRQSFNTNWMIGTVENSFSLEAVKATYDVYLLEVINGQLKKIIDINKQLKINDTNAYEMVNTK